MGDEMQRKLVILRNRGNFGHNIKVLATKKGKLLVVKNPTLIKDVAQFAPCLFCLGFFHLPDIWKHIRASCPYNYTNPVAQLPNTKVQAHLSARNSNNGKASCNKYVIEGKRLLYSSISPRVSNLCTKVCADLKDDEMSEIIKKDDIILAF